MSLTQLNQRKAEDEFTHLPYFLALKDYGTEKWICFGTLTHKYPNSATTQLERFRTLMDTIGSLNRSFGKRLHWVVRVEGHKEDVGKRSEEETRTHLHFLLARHKVTDGHKHQFTPAEACKFLENVWEYGRAEVMPFDPSREGLEYILKCPAGPKSEAWEDTVEISRSLMTYLMEKKLSEQTRLEHESLQWRAA